MKRRRKEDEKKGERKKAGNERLERGRRGSRGENGGGAGRKLGGEAKRKRFVASRTMKGRENAKQPGTIRIEDLNVRVNPLHVRLEVPLSIAPVTTVRTALGFLLATRRLYVFHQMMLPTIRFRTFRTLVSVGTFVPEHSDRLAIGPEITSLVRASFRRKLLPLGYRRRLEYLIVLPKDQFT